MRLVDSWSVGILTCDLVRVVSPFYVPTSKREMIANRKGYKRNYEVVFDRIREVGDFVEVDVPEGEVESNSKSGWSGGRRREGRRKNNGSGVALSPVEVDVLAGGGEE